MIQAGGGGFFSQLRIARRVMPQSSLAVEFTFIPPGRVPSQGQVLIHIHLHQVAAMQNARTKLIHLTAALSEVTAALSEGAAWRVASRRMTEIVPLDRANRAARAYRTRRNTLVLDSSFGQRLDRRNERCERGRRREVPVAGRHVHPETGAIKFAAIRFGKFAIATNGVVKIARDPQLASVIPCTSSSLSAVGGDKSSATGGPKGAEKYS
jgi:hypothetical protein